MATKRRRRRASQDEAESGQPIPPAVDPATSSHGGEQDGRRTSRAREVGEVAFYGLQRSLARAAADMIRNDPADAAVALEMGIIDRKWLDQRGDGPVSTTPPLRMVERFLERIVEQRPSRLSAIGLSALQILSTQRSDGTGDATQTVAVLFTDLEGFTAFTDANGDAAALELLEEHYRRAGPLIRSFSGRIVKRLGDGLLCTFSDPEMGVRAALEMLDLAPEPLRLRAGLHVGNAIVSNHDVVGQVVNVAARVTETARGGQIAVTEDVATAAGDVKGANFGKPRMRRLKGISEPVAVRILTPAT